MEAGGGTSLSAQTGFIGSVYFAFQHGYQFHGN
jgi:hypothetical protein